MTEFIKKYEIWIFLILGPILNVFFVLARAQGLMPKFVYNHGRFCVLLLFLICLLKYTRGNDGVKDIFRPMLVWKVEPKWYLFSFMFAFTVGIFTLVLKGFYLGDNYDTFLTLNHKAMTLKGIVVLLIWAFLGEVVWVGYCIRELSKRLIPFYASQIVGIAWALWWVPIVLLGEGILPGFPIWALSLFMLGNAGMCAIVYGKTKSGICVLILQFMLNITLNILALSPSQGGVTTYTAYAIIYFTVMLCFIYFMNLKRNKQYKIRSYFVKS